MDPSKDVDLILNKLGRYGRYQVTQFLVLLVDIWPCALHILSIVFIGYRPPFTCNEATNMSASLDGLYTHGENETLEMEYGECSIDIYRNTSGNWTHLGDQRCTNGYNYSTPRDRTIVTQFDLVCEGEELGELSQTLLMLGQGFGAMIFTPMADRYGRKPVHIGCNIALLVVCLVTSFAPSYTVFVILRFLTGGIQQGMGLTDAILYLEMFPMEVRAYGECFGLLFWSTGCVLLAPIAYLLRNVSWRYLQITLSLFSIYSIFQYWMIDESLRWLIANGKLKEARRVIRKAAKKNKVDPEELLKIIDKYDTNYPDVVESEVFKELIQNDKVEKLKQEDFQLRSPIYSQEKNMVTEKVQAVRVVKHYTPLDILKNKHLLFTSLIMWYSWLVNSLTYYGLYMISSELAGNRFLNYFLGAIVEYPACFLEFILINRIGRKKTAIMFHAVAAITLIAASVMMTIEERGHGVEEVTTILILLGKMSITGSFSTIFLYTPELYPTNLRNAGLGMASTLARAGGMVAPYSTTLARYAIWAPGAIFGAMCLVVTGLLTLLPETMEVELPQTIEELDAWYEKRHQNKRKKSGKSGVNGTQQSALVPPDVKQTVVTTSPEICDTN